MEKTSYGFVEYLDHGSASLATMTLNRRHLFAQPIKVSWAYTNVHIEDKSSHLKISVEDRCPKVEAHDMFAEKLQLLSVGESEHKKDREDSDGVSDTKEAKEVIEGTRGKNEYASRIVCTSEKVFDTRFESDMFLVGEQKLVVAYLKLIYEHEAENEGQLNHDLLCLQQAPDSYTADSLLGEFLMFIFDPGGDINPNKIWFLRNIVSKLSRLRGSLVDLIIRRIPYTALLTHFWRSLCTSIKLVFGIFIGPIKCGLDMDDQFVFTKYEASVDLLTTIGGTANHSVPVVLSHKDYDGVVNNCWPCGVNFYVLMDGYLPFGEVDIVTLYCKIDKIEMAEFSCPSWVLIEEKSVSYRLLVAQKRIRIGEVMNDEWLNNNYVLVGLPELEDLHSDVVNASVDVNAGVPYGNIRELLSRLQIGAWRSYWVDTWEEFKHTLHVFNYAKEDLNSLVEFEWMAFVMAGWNSYGQILLVQNSIICQVCFIKGKIHMESLYPYGACNFYGCHGRIQKKRKGSSDAEKLVKTLHDSSLNFKCSTLEKATGSIDESIKLGQLMNPSIGAMLHRIVGIFYTLRISDFVSLLREISWNRGLYFLQGHVNMNYNPLRGLIGEHVHNKDRRVLLLYDVYGSLTVESVIVIVKRTRRVVTLIFHHDISEPEPFAEVPVDMLLFQIGVLFANKQFKLRASITYALWYWLSSVTCAFGLSDYLMPKYDDNDSYFDNFDDGHESNDHMMKNLAMKVLPTIASCIFRKFPEDLLKDFIGWTVHDSTFLFKLLLEQGKQEFVISLIHMLSVPACVVIINGLIASCPSNGSMFCSDVQKLPNNSFENSYLLGAFESQRRDQSFAATVARLCMDGVAAGMLEEGHVKVLRALLDGCRIHKNLDEGKRIIEHLCVLEPLNAENHLMLSNWYAQLNLRPLKCYYLAINDAEGIVKILAEKDTIDCYFGR